MADLLIEDGGRTLLEGPGMGALLLERELEHPLFGVPVVILGGDARGVMLARTYIVGDRLRGVAAQLKTEDGRPVDLTHSFVAFRMVNTITGEVKIAGSEAMILTATTGIVQYDWGPTDVDTSGEYWGWFIHMRDDKIEHFPAGNFFKVIINPNTVDYSMSVPLATVLKRVRNLVGSNNNLSDTEILEIINSEHVSVLGDNPWSERKAFGTIVTTGQYTTGTVTTSGTTVTGVDTTFTSSMSGSWIRIGSETAYYLITGFTDPLHLVIERAIAPGDVTEPTPYVIFTTLYQMPSDFDRMQSIVYQTRLVEGTREDLDRIDPYRMWTDSIPTTYVMSRMGANPPRTPGAGVSVHREGLWQVEIWPVPSAAVQLRFQYAKANKLLLPSDMPLYRSDVLVWKSAMTAAYALHSKTGDQNWLDLADRYTMQYEKSLQGARLDDLAKNSPANRIRDVVYVPVRPYSSDWAAAHDNWYGISASW